MYRYRWWVLVIAVGVVGMFGWMLWQGNQPPSLLPRDLTQKIHDFTPYFYKQMPADYTVDLQHVVYDNGVLMVPLLKQGVSSTVITEQALSANLSVQELQQNGETVQNTAASATINNVEGRLVGTMAAQNGHTLILISVTNNDDATKNDLTLLLRGLQPLR